VILEDDVFVGPNAAFTNDRFPRSKHYPEKFAKTLVRQGASIGANATILPGLEIGRCAMVGAGAVVTKSVPPHAIVAGNPARIIGYEPSSFPVEVVPTTEAQEHALPSLGIKGVQLVELPLIQDLRGHLSFAQYADHLPFIPQRYFLIYEVSSKEVRGEHAHLNLHEFLVCVKGACAVMVDDGQNRAEVHLNRPNFGLHIPPMVWTVQYKYTMDAVLLVLASDIYRAEDYIRDYEEFLRMVQTE
jgi:UDP-2-acetamido-3-amino-2,3-dideoxy-glucuronate N-acetyltransferase